MKGGACEHAPYGFFLMMGANVATSGLTGLKYRFKLDIGTVLACARKPRRAQIKKPKGLEWFSKITRESALALPNSYTVLPSCFFDW